MKIEIEVQVAQHGDRLPMFGGLYGYSAERVPSENSARSEVEEYLNAHSYNIPI